MAEFQLEVVPSAEAATSSLSARGLAAEKAVSAVRETGAAIAEACNELFAPLRDGFEQAAPAELEITFGVSVAAETGVPVVGKLAADSSFSVRALWRR